MASDRWRRESAGCGTRRQWRGAAIPNPAPPAPHQRVGAEVLVHHHHGEPSGMQAFQPLQEQTVQGRVADAHRGVAVDAVDAKSRRDFVGRADPRPRAAAEVVAAGDRHPGGGEVYGGQIQRPPVDVGRPDRGVRRPECQRHGDRAVAAADVRQRPATVAAICRRGAVGRRRPAGCGRQGRIFQEEARTRVDAVRREDAAVGAQGRRDIRQLECDGALLAPRAGIRREIVLRPSHGADDTPACGTPGRCVGR